MAKFAEITVKNIDKVNEFLTAEDFSAITSALATNGATSATFGACFDMKDRDTKHLVIIQNTNASAAKVATIKAGNSIQGVTDIDISLAAGKYTAVVVESGRFKNVTENPTLRDLSSATEADKIGAKGKVFITGDSADIKVAVIKLPC